MSDTQLLDAVREVNTDLERWPAVMPNKTEMSVVLARLSDEPLD